MCGGPIITAISRALKVRWKPRAIDRDRFDVLLVQLVNLLRDGQPVAMSTRAGEFVTLADVIKEVGRDAARFIFLSRNYDSPLDFDLELAKKKQTTTQYITFSMFMPESPAFIAKQ
jgi:arginyl-tRNA synthetase